MRMVALMNMRSQVMLDAQLSPYRRSELRLAKEFIAAIPNNSVTLFDKGFWGAGILLNVANQGQQRHWLIPERKGLIYEEIDRYSENDRLLQMKVSPQARKRNPNLPETWQVRAVRYTVSGKSKTVFTPLPHEHYSDAQVADLYHERWEIELGFRDIKSSMQNNKGVSSTR